LLLATDSLASWEGPQRTMGYMRDWWRWHTQFQSVH
jgi:hypothetical protein